MNATMTRKPAVAGQFYPGKAKELRETVQEYIGASGVEPAPDRVVAVVAPHAGYIYSGPTAGFAYARVKGKKPKRVIVMGSSHRYHFEMASTYDRGAFETPLGDVPIDGTFAKALIEKVGSGPVDPHMLEHSLEVQLPFLIVAIGEVPIVPILFGSHSTAWHAQFAETLAGMADESDLVVASTDLSHYMTEEEANEIDKASVDAVLAQDWAAFADGIASGRCSMCGATAVATTMAYALARGAKAWSLLDYSTSGNTSGDYDRVVGYAAISMERDA